MRALSRADEYVVHHPDRARDIIQKRLGYSDEYMESIWKEHQFSLSLDQAYILTMEDEARWLIKNQFSATQSMPNFLNVIYFDAIEETKPTMVTIPH